MVKLHICGNTTQLLGEMTKSGADLYNVDHLVSLSRANEVYSKHGLCYKGNLDPVAHILRADPEDCRIMAEECIRKAQGSRFILSAGCEIPAKTPDEVFSAFCKAPQTYQFTA